MAPALDDYFMACFDFSSNCSEFVDEYILKENNQKTYGAPMLWIGIYVAAVSLVCSLAMAADAYQGFRQRKLWFPSKFFGLNAASLTLLAVAMKLPVDLTSSMEGSTDQLAKLSSTAFMCTIIGNLMPSIGPMDNRDILLNVIAVSILVISILGNVCIKFKTHVISTDAFNVAKEHVIAMLFMLLLLVILSFSALAVPISKRILELKYRDMHKTVSTEEPKESNKSSVEILKDVVRKYWLMAETGSPQFVMACSATSSTSGVICLMVAVLLVEAEVLIVVASITVCLISVFVARPILSGLDYCKRLQEEKVTRNSHKGSDTEPGVELGRNRYIMKLEGFKGIVEFDSNQVPSLHSEEPPNTWSLPVVTLTSIAISLPNIKSHIADSLLCSVNEGVSYARLIDQTLENIEDWINLKDAANFVWVRVELYRKWLDEDLQRIALKGKTCRENLQRLADIAKDYVMEFLSNVNSGPEPAPLNWPVEVNAANSMYRISQTLLLQHQDNHQSNEELFEQLIV
ncbi:hypothetical protein RJ640_029977 [Escallonia rubra]|uniref:Uncharacterized protein n=1 Tax=Escallonia rubra TaxID=112253 RepID=A0AA88R9K0_9ASTE|nr:hypothetical protein RJ640_029977 [Escallonia rubra]